MPYTPEELQTLKEIRLANKKRYQADYYLRVTKPQRAKRSKTNH